jgi:anti-sigma-K factor RskA
MSDPDVPDTGPEADEVRAAELAFGLLEPDVRAETEARVTSDAGFAALYRRWQARAAALLEGREERPPARVWAAIARRLPANDTHAVRRWQAATAVAASAALAFGATLALRREPPVASPPVERPVPPPPLVAVLTSPERADVVAVSYDTISRRVSALPQRLATDGRDPELWVIPTGGKPVSAGLLSPAARTSIVQDPRIAALIVPGATLAISLEPRGGSRTGAPTGPVILTGTIARS